MSCCIYNSSVLCFCSWECNGTMFLAWLDNWSFSKHEHISWCWLSIYVVTCPITVSKPNQIKIRFSFVEDPMSPCSLNKVKDPFGFSPMDLMRLIHVSWSHTYCISVKTPNFLKNLKKIVNAYNFRNYNKLIIKLVICYQINYLNYLFGYVYLAE